MKCRFMRSEVGLLPADDPSRAWFAPLKIGTEVEGEFTQPRNPKFHRRFFALLNLGYDYWSETVEPQEHKGVPIQTDFERFRKDVIIMSGFFKTVVNIKQELRLEAESIAFGSMSEERFEKLYSAVIGTLLKIVFKNDAQWSEPRLRTLVDEICGFS